MRPVDKSAAAPSPRDVPKEGSSRRGTPVEQALVNRFRAALEAKGQRDLADSTAEGADEMDDGLSGAHEQDRESIAPVQEDRDHDTSSGGQEHGDVHTPGWSPVMTPAGTAAAAIAAATSGAPVHNAAVVAQLLEKHVKQMLVAESTPMHGDHPSVMLNLTDAVLPGTQMTLTQTEEGWRLDSQSSSTSSYRAIRDLAPQLQARFAERGLGELSLDVTLQEASRS